MGVSEEEVLDAVLPVVAVPLSVLFPLTRVAVFDLRGPCNNVTGREVVDAPRCAFEEAEALAAPILLESAVMEPLGDRPLVKLDTVLVVV